MKATLSVLTILSALLITLNASAGDSPAKKESAPSKTAKRGSKDKKETTELLTGSYIKREVRRTGLITDGADRVFVIDNATLQNTGAADLKQVLARRGFRR